MSYFSEYIADGLKMSYGNNSISFDYDDHSKKYIEEVINYGKKLLNKFNLSKIVVGINGQISYGLGILVHSYNTKFEFNANYNPDYYVKELDEVKVLINKG